MTVDCGCVIQVATREHSEHVTPSLWKISITDPQNSHFSLSWYILTVQNPDLSTGFGKVENVGVTEMM